MSKPFARDKRVVFLREATGLVRTVNPLQATFWNVANIMGSQFPWSVARLGIFPAVMILGTSPYLWVVLLVGLAYYILGFIYIQITSTIPRSGADYVIPSRLIGPFWGWIGSWMAVAALVPLWGFITWATLRNLKQLIDILRIGGLTTLSVPWILSGTPALMIGIVLITSCTLICIMPGKRYYEIMGLLAVGAVLSLVVMISGTLVASPATFNSNFHALVGESTTDLVQTAIKGGFNPNGELSLVGVAELAGIAVFSLTGFQYSASIGGELKGKVKRTLTISIIGSLSLVLVCLLSFIWIVLYRFDYSLVVGWSYLFWNGMSGTPFSLPPINALLLTIGMPRLAILWAAIGLILLVGAWLYIPATMLYINRIALSWGIDRMIPSSLSEVNPRYGQPFKLVLVEGVLAVFFFALTLVKLNPVTFLWWSSLLTFPTLLFPAVSALRFGRRYPELLEMMPWRRLLKPLAVAWSLIIVSLYGLVIVAGLLPSVAETTLWQYTMSSGLGVTCLVILLGIIIYVAVRAINAKRGIDMHLIFKSIPPE